tara:strand:- start:15884 stop:17134 length:1251 start_codon:yes stop_codon:yes gene_type:complete
MLSVALVGFGTVGKAVAKILDSGLHGGLCLSYVFNRNIEDKKVDWLAGQVVWTDDINAIISSDVDVVVEVVGGEDPAVDWIRRALESGKSVVTANKQAIAHQGAELEAIAIKNGKSMFFGAAVAGGVPVINGVTEGLAGDQVVGLCGILNGTCNFILTRMEIDGLSFDAALAEAQELGFAESDPTADVDGFDAQAKLAILSAVGLGLPLDVNEITTGSIRPVEAVDFIYARRLGCTIRQIARAVSMDNEKVAASVVPMLVERSSTLARIEGSQNIVVFEGKTGGETAFSGHGAGGGPTAVAVVSDLEKIARNRSGLTTGVLGGTQTTKVFKDLTCPHYARFVIKDRPGIIAALADVFSQHGIGVDSVLQEPGWSKEELPFVMTLESCSSTAAMNAVGEAAIFDFQIRPPVCLPVLT